MPIRNARMLVGALTLLGLGGAQLIRPDLTNPAETAPFESAAVIPPGVQHILQRACQDCHSNRTRWPWYARTVPLSWVIQSDVKRGRDFLNFSEWPRYTTGRKCGVLAAMGAVTRSGAMPPAQYLALHKDARLTAEERTRIAQWTTREYLRLRPLTFPLQSFYQSRTSSSLHGGEIAVGSISTYLSNRASGRVISRPQ